VGGLSSFLSAALVAWLGLLIGLTALRMLSGRISMRGLLLPEPGRPIAPERLVAVAVFPMVLATLVYDSLTADIAATPSLPNVSNDVIALLTGSNVLYLSGKIARKS
jgi:hypothetical protein